MTHLLQIRKALRLSQHSLAGKIGVVQGSVSAYERGTQEISPAVAKRLVAVAKAAGLPIGLDHVYGLAEIPESEGVAQ